jgi:NADH:quinone reductase (non-electrogenic)
MSQSTRVVVLGGGYSGVMTAVRLASRTRSAAVTLVSERDTFVERVRLHQYAASQKIRQRPFTDLLQGTRVEFVRGTVTRIDLDQQRVSLDDNRELSYEYLVYALGSHTAPDKHAYTLNVSGERSVEDLRAELPGVAQRGGRLLVVGGGPTGVESAAELAESFPGLHVALVTRGDVLPLLPGKPRDYATQQLTRLGVDITTDSPVVELRDKIALLPGGKTLEFDVCLWCGGFQPTELARQSGLAVNENNQVLVDSRVCSISHPSVLAVGDAAHIADDIGVEHRMGAFTATVTGAHAADVLAKRIQNRELRPLSFSYVGLGVALGRHDAIGINTYPYGAPNRFPLLTGRLAASVRETFVNYLNSAARLERLRPGLFSWIGAPKKRVILREEPFGFAQGRLKDPLLVTGARVADHSPRSG